MYHLTHTTISFSLRAHLVDLLVTFLLRPMGIGMRIVAVVSKRTLLVGQRVGTVLWLLLGKARIEIAWLYSRILHARPELPPFGSRAFRHGGRLVLDLIHVS